MKEKLQKKLNKNLNTLRKETKKNGSKTLKRLGKIAVSHSIKRDAFKKYVNSQNYYDGTVKNITGNKKNE